MVRLVLPYHLRTLAQVEDEISLSLGDHPTLAEVLDALETCHPVLRGTIRDRATRHRRPFIRFFACSEDISHAGQDALLPAAICQGQEPLFIVGAMAGG